MRERYGRLEPAATDERSRKGPASELVPRWRSDRVRIERGGPYQIWVVNGDGSNLRSLTDDPSYHFGYHAWSPSGDRLFTTSETTWNPMILDPRLSWSNQKPERLPRAPRERFSSTAWSPDGRRLAGWTPEGIATCDFHLRTYEVVTHDRAILPQWVGSNRLDMPHADRAS